MKVFIKNVTLSESLSFDSLLGMLAVPDVKHIFIFRSFWKTLRSWVAIGLWRGSTSYTGVFITLWLLAASFLTLWLLCWSNIRPTWATISVPTTLLCSFSKQETIQTRLLKLFNIAWKNIFQISVCLFLKMRSPPLYSRTGSIVH